MRTLRLALALGLAPEMIASSAAIHKKMYGTCGNDMTSKSADTVRKQTAAAAAASPTGAPS